MPRGWEEFLSQAPKVIVEGENLGDLSYFEIFVGITQVDAPLSIMHWEMMALWTRTGIWKAMDEGNGGCSDVSTWKTIKWSLEGSLEGSTTPKEVSRAFFWDGHDCSTSTIDMVAGDCAKSYTILYVRETQLEVTLRCNGPFGILGIDSNLGWGICNRPFDVIRGSVDVLVLESVADKVDGLSYWHDRVYRLISEGLTST